jgi:hypothetical protein
MPANFTVLDAALADLVIEVTQTETVEASATAALLGALQVTADAVAAALKADNAVDDAAAAAANTAVAQVIARIKASRDPLAAAVAANPGPGGQPTPPAE